MTKLSKDNEKKINFISKRRSNSDRNAVQVPPQVLDKCKRVTDICAKCSLQGFG